MNTASGNSEMLPASPGGLGGSLVFLPENPGARDTRLLERAIRERWEIPPALRARLPAILVEILVSPDSSPRSKIAAARALLAADTINLEQEKRNLQIPDRLHVTGALSLRAEDIIRAGREIEALRAQSNGSHD